MTRVWPFLGLILAFFCSFIQNSFAHLNLEDRWRIEEQEPMGLMSSQTLRLLDGKPILFVKGIMNELAKITRSYYTANEKAARALGMDIYEASPSSWMSVSDNGEIVAQRIKNIYDATSKPVTVIAHSKGGSEALYGYLMHPELNNKVDRLVLIQASVGGSPLADDSLSWRMTALSFFSHPGVSSLFRWPGLESLYPDAIERTFIDASNSYIRYFESIYSGALVEERKKSFLDKI